MMSSFNNSNSNKNTKNQFLSGRSSNASANNYTHRPMFSSDASVHARGTSLNAFSSLKSFNSSIPPQPLETTAAATAATAATASASTSIQGTIPYNKNVDFPSLTPARTPARVAKVAASSIETGYGTGYGTGSEALCYRTAVITSTAAQRAQQDRIRKEIENELKMKEETYEQLRRDAARSRDVATALAAAANYDISDISESVDASV